MEFIDLMLFGIRNDARDTISMEGEGVRQFNV